MSEKKATAPTVARTNTKRAESYQQSFGESNEILKEFLGALLLRLSAGREGQDGWRLFEVLLRQHYE